VMELEAHVKSTMGHLVTDISEIYSMTAND